MKIKKWNGTSWVQDYPEVNIDAIVATGTPSSTTYLRGDGSWSTVDTDTNTTYSISAVDSANDAIIRLSGSDSTTDDVKLVAGSNITLTPSGDNITISATDTNTVYTHPTHPGDDINIDTGALTGAWVISDLDFNITSDTLGHITDANGAIATRQLTATDIGLGNVTNESKATMFTSPSFTGTPTAPTAANSTNNTQLATTAFVTNKLAGIGGGGLNFEGTISLSTSKTADDLYAAGLTAEGDYLIVSATGNIVSGGTLLSLAVQSPGDEGDSTLPVTLETGDWIVFVSNVSQVLTVAIINNTDTRFASSVHNHSASEIVTGELNTARMGSGTATSGYVLKSDGDGTASWQVDNNTTYSLGSFGITATATELNYTDGVTSNIQTQLNGKLSTSGKAADSNLLDNLDSSQFLRSDVSDTVAAGRQISFYSNNTIDTSSGDQASLEVYNGTVGEDAFMQFHIGGDYAAYFGLHGGINDFVVGGWSKGATYQRLFHDGYHPNADTLTTARTISLTGDVTGSTSFNGSANVSITATVADDSHNHIIGNVDGLQTALDGKLPLIGGTLTGTLTTRQINMQNYNLTGVNQISINDPGPNEGIFFGGNFSVWESPDDLTTNSSGNLQFVSGSTRRMTIDTSGNVTVGNNLYAQQLYMGGGGRWYNDSGTRIKTENNLYVSTSNIYLYGDNTYIGNSSGDNIRFRGNLLLGDSWSISTNGTGSFADLEVTGNTVWNQGNLDFSLVGSTLTITTS